MRIRISNLTAHDACVHREPSWFDRMFGRSAEDRVVFMTRHGEWVYVSDNREVEPDVLELIERAVTLSAVKRVHAVLTGGKS